MLSFYRYTTGIWSNIEYFDGGMVKKKCGMVFFNLNKQVSTRHSAGKNVHGSRERNGQHRHKKNVIEAQSSCLSSGQPLLDAEEQKQPS